MFDKHPQNTGLYWAVAASTILTSVITLIGTYFIVQQPQIDQVGGRENYKLYKEMVNHPSFVSRNKEGIQGQLDVFNGDEPAADDSANEAPAATSGTLSQDEISSIKADTYIDGNENADILWVEYSDLECPFCKRQHDSKAIPNLMAKYDGKVSTVFKHYPLPFHPLAKPGALTAECVGEVWGADKFLAFVDQVFTNGTPTTAIMDAAIKAIGVDATKVKSCVDAGKYNSKIDAHTAEAQTKFNVNGTPGNVLINTKTGKYEIVSGAQPEANFDAAITRLLAE